MGSPPAVQELREGFKAAEGLSSLVVSVTLVAPAAAGPSTHSEQVPALELHAGGASQGLSLLHLPGVQES